MAALEGPENVMATALGLALGLFGPMWGFCVPFVRFRAGRRFRRGMWNLNNINRLLVGAPRFELGTPSPPDWCANRAALRSEALGWGIFADLRRFASRRNCRASRDKHQYIFLVYLNTLHNLAWDACISRIFYSRFMYSRADLTSSAI